MIDPSGSRFQERLTGGGPESTAFSSPHPCACGRSSAAATSKLQFHVEHKIEEGRRRALIALGRTDQRKEEVRDIRRINWLTDFLAKLKAAARPLWRPNRCQVLRDAPNCLA